MLITMQLPAIALFYLLFAAFLTGIASTIAVITLLFSGREGQRRSSCFFQSVIVVCLLLAAYLAYAGITLVVF